VGYGINEEESVLEIKNDSYYTILAFPLAHLPKFSDYANPAPHLWHWDLAGLRSCARIS